MKKKKKENKINHLICAVLSVKIGTESSLI